MSHADDDLDRAIALLQSALLEIDATGWCEGVLFGPDQAIAEKIAEFLDEMNVERLPYP